MKTLTPIFIICFLFIIPTSSWASNCSLFNSWRTGSGDIEVTKEWESLTADEKKLCIGGKEFEEGLKKNQKDKKKGSFIMYSQNIIFGLGVIMIFFIVSQKIYRGFARKKPNNINQQTNQEEKE